MCGLAIHYAEDTMGVLAFLIQLTQTPLPIILVLSGLFFLFLAIVGKFGASIVVNPRMQTFAAVLGGFLLAGGITLYFVSLGSIPPSEPTPTTTTVKQSQLALTQHTKLPPAEGDGIIDSVPLEEKSREEWLQGNYNAAVDDFAVIATKGPDTDYKNRAAKRLEWLQPYRGSILFADDFEDDTLIESIWGLHPGHPPEKNSFFKRVLINGNFVLEGHGHHHAVAHRVATLLEHGAESDHFEVHLKFFPVTPLTSAAHINTTLDPPKGRYTVSLSMAEKRVGLFEEWHGQPMEQGINQSFESRWYRLRITIEGHQVQIFLDDQLIFVHESRSPHPLLNNLNLETLTGTVRFDDLLVITR
jgi:hypothetical protein